MRNKKKKKNAELLSYMTINVWQFPNRAGTWSGRDVVLQADAEYTIDRTREQWSSENMGTRKTRILKIERVDLENLVFTGIIEGKRDRGKGFTVNG